MTADTAGYVRLERAPVTVKPFLRLAVREKDGTVLAEVIELGQLVLLRVGDRDLALTPQSAIKLAEALVVAGKARS